MFHRHPPGAVHGYGKSCPYTGNTSVLAVHAPTAGAARYTVRIAADSTEIAAAQRLRHRVFAGELGARPSSRLRSTRLPWWYR